MQYFSCRQTILIMLCFINVRESIIGKSRRTLRLLLTGVCLVTILGCTHSASPTKMTITADMAAEFDLSPDGKTIVFTGSGSGVQDLYTLDLNSLHISRICDTPDYEYNPKFSPSGKRIIFAATTPDFTVPSHIYSCNIDGTHKIQISHDKYGYDRNPVYLDENGINIAFTRSTLRRAYSFGGYTSTNWDIWTLNTVTGREQQITNSKYYDIFSLDNSGDGSSLLYSAYSSDADLSASMWIVRPLGSTSPTQIHVISPSWIVPEPAYAVFTRSNKINFLAGPSKDATAYSWEIDSIKSDGTKPTRLAVIKGLVSSIRTDYTDKYVYYLADPHPPASGEKLQLWRLDISTKESTLVADNRLFSNPFLFSK